MSWLNVRALAMGAGLLSLAWGSAWAEGAGSAFADGTSYVVVPSKALGGKASAIEVPKEGGVVSVVVAEAMRSACPRGEKPRIGLTRYELTFGSVYDGWVDAFVATSVNFSGKPSGCQKAGEADEVFHLVGGNDESFKFTKKLVEKDSDFVVMTKADFIAASRSR